jgi:hypothetical protein
MKRIVLIGVIAIVALGIYAVFIHPHPRRAPPGVYFTLIHLPVRSGSTLTGVEPGTRVVCVKDEGPVVLVKVNNLEFEANGNISRTTLTLQISQLGTTPKRNKP